MRNLAELGFKKYGHHRPFPPFSDSTLHAFEFKFGVRLPEEYVAMLRLFNGGELTARLYVDPVMGHGGIDEFFGLGIYRRDITAESRDWEMGNLWEETPSFRLHLLKGRGVPFTRDGGGNELFFDFDSNDANPPINRIVVATRKPYHIANSFSEFVDTLYEDKTDSVKRYLGKPREWRVN